MQFTAYITRRESQQYEVPISRIAQIFAADIMPGHCHNYASRCNVSRIAPDTTNYTPHSSSHIMRLLPDPLPTSSQFIFHGYPAGILESFLLQAASCNASQPDVATSSENRTPFHSGAEFPSTALIDASIRRIHKDHTTSGNMEASIFGSRPVIRTSLNFRDNLSTGVTSSAGGDEISRVSKSGRRGARYD